MNIGIIGCGNISPVYFNAHKLYNNFKVTACADIDEIVAKKSANEFNVSFQTIDEIISNPNIDIILNLTIPSAHKEVIIKTLNAGKHSFSEKPLAISFKEGREIYELAKEKKFYVGCAPDTFLGSAGQKARELIDNNTIGDVVLGTFNIMSHGMEHWHPNPDFFFKPGAGPIFDLGVYYITQLVNLLGPVESILSVSGTASEERIITSEPRNGEKIKVETPTTLLGVLNFKNKAKVQLFASWDVWKHEHTTIELYGLDGSMVIPDPNYFGGKLKISKKDSDWKIIDTKDMFLGIPNKENDDGFVANYRGIGLSDMVNCIKQNKKFRCSIELTLHVLEIMDGILTSSVNTSIYNTITICDKPEFLSENEISRLKIN
jgi:predicted dehydrogenase